MSKHCEQGKLHAHFLVQPTIRPWAHRHPLSVGATLTIVCMAAMPLAAQTVTDVPAATGAAQARPTTDAGSVNLRLSAQPLGQALNALAQQADIQILFSAELTKGRMATPVQGQYSVKEALQRLLAGTGLEATRSGSGWQIRVSQVGIQGNEANVLKEVLVTAPAQADSSTENSASYAATYTNTAKTALTLREIPQSVTVVTRQRMDDQALKTLDAVMEQTTGISQSTTWNGAYTFYARGQSVNNIRYDGGASVSNGAGFGSLSDMAMYDNVTVLRGADGLFGAGEAGGVLMLNHKRPQAEQQTQLSASIGRWNNYRAELDTTGTLGLDGRLRGRLIAVHQDQDYFYDWGKDKRSVLYGALETDLSPDTLLLLGASYQKDKRKGIYEGIGRMVDGSPLPLPRTVNTGAPWNLQDVESNKIFLKLDHRFNADWSVSANLQRTYTKSLLDYVNLRGPVNPITFNGPYWAGYFDREKVTDTAMDLNLAGKFDALGQRHDVLLGMDMTNSNAYSSMGWVEYPFANVNLLSGLYPSRETYLNESQMYPGTTDSKHRKTGFYGSLRLRPADQWSLIVGGRYVLNDRYRQYNDAGELNSERKESNVWVPYAGVIFDVAPSTSLYASTAEIYQSQATQLSAPLPGTPLDPVTGRNYELGIKGELLDGRANGSFALYRVEKKGMASQDPAYPEGSVPQGQNCCYFRDGYQLSQGFETELSGEIAPGLQLSAGYTYNANHNRRQNDARFSTVTPRHLLKIWANQRFSGDWQGLQLGVGMVAQSQHYQSGSVRVNNTTYPYQFSQGGYALWSARAEYAVNKTWSVAINIHNLFDKTYFHTVSGTSYANFYGAPRNILLTMRAKY